MVKRPHNISQVGVGRERKSMNVVAANDRVIKTDPKLFDDTFIKENKRLSAECLDYCKDQLNYSDSTLRDYECLMRIYLGYLGNTDLRTIEIFDVHKYFAARLKKNKQESVNRDRSVLRIFFMYVDKIRKVRLTFDYSMIHNAKTDDPETRFVTVDQYRSILAVITDEQDRLVVATLFGGGLRIGEVVRLSPDWIGDGELRVKGKGGKRRVVPVPKDLTDALRTFAYERGISQGPIFRHQVEKRTLTKVGYTVNGLRKRLYRILRPYGIIMRPHDLRHGMATLLASSGVDIRNLQLYLGHKRIDTTQRYWHVTNPTLNKNIMEHMPDEIKFNLLGG